MYSVTSRIASVKQPRGGYVPVHAFDVMHFQDSFELQKENISPIITGLAVDYLTRYMLTGSAQDAFDISLRGARIAGETSLAQKLIKQISGLDDLSIISACKLSGYDTCYRAGTTHFKPVNTISPNSDTIQNIRIMVMRCLYFFEAYGPVVSTEITFDGGYTHIISQGDADYLTSDTLWDLKVSVKAPTTRHTLQLLVYYLMGIHSIHPELHNVQNIGIFNPRIHAAYILPVSSISDDTIEEVSTSIIGYASGFSQNSSAPSSYADSTEALDYQSSASQDMLTISEAAEYLGLRKKKVRKLIQSNLLHARKTDSGIRITERELNNYIRFQKKMRGIVFFILFVVIVLFLLLVFDSLFF